MRWGGRRGEEIDGFGKENGREENARRNETERRGGVEEGVENEREEGVENERCRQHLRTRIQGRRCTHARL